ncbi:hypothetical protein [Leptospira kanakyensis]|uniref:Uncharacterized protein n=1 Tax=Leptospira kanakyensis TaxID=2484968 RepID=A0A6N4PXM1_9LEPT|nr:hypothetical protein [Leptospira kanakyensis]MCW7469157.1 hypothetical protein [Leptospira kanakyensis]MCW7480146.1 hypothetical protein [Leptospira kanakyensis]TGK50355.1 hypothetical protein EHQ11_11705 [Leptospira kanakyensis]TGK64043.1 hypothetical protein EHQ16_06315 [Leptospira kanakyensis]TGK69495.1 hypothetical protein EHQ18_11865 [Leptospira kanakyensis]
MEISSNVARVSGLGEPYMYVSPAYNTQAVEQVEAIQSRSYQPKYVSGETEKKAAEVQTSPDAKAAYKPGNLVNLYA